MQQCKVDFEKLFFGVRTLIKFVIFKRKKKIKSKTKPQNERRILSNLHMYCFSELIVFLFFNLLKNDC